MFSEFKAMLDELLAVFTTAATEGHMTAFASFVGIYFSMTVLLRGYMILAGKTEDPIRDLIWDMIVKMIIVTFAFHGNGWITLVESSINGLAEWAGGGNTPDGLYAKLDTMYGNVQNISGKMSSLDGYLEIKGWVSGKLVVFSFLVVAIFGATLVALSTLALQILIMLSPLMILSLIFPLVKQMFGRWVEFTISSLLTILVVGISLEAMSLKLNKIITELLRDETLRDNNVDSLAIDFFVGSIFIFFMVYLSFFIARQLSTASIDTIAASSARSGAGSASRGIGNRMDRKRANKQHAETIAAMKSNK